jgi:hypothetical protein
MAEVTVRLRYPLEGDARLGLSAGGQALEAVVPADTAQLPPRDRRLAQRRQDRLARGRAARAAARRELAKVYLDGRDVTKQAKIPSPDFAHGLCPVEITLPQPLALGSFHTYKLVAADGAAGCLHPAHARGVPAPRHLRGHQPRGRREGRHQHLHPLRPPDQGRAGRLCRLRPPQRLLHPRRRPGGPAGTIPATYGYHLHDEPDCWDYSADEWPMPMRVGFHAPDMVHDTARWAAQEPEKPVILTLDLTFKPANYYVYSQIADILAPDCYPLAVGQQPRWVREVTDVARLAAGPAEGRDHPAGGLRGPQQHRDEVPPPAVLTRGRHPVLRRPRRRRARLQRLGVVRRKLRLRVLPRRAELSRRSWRPSAAPSAASSCSSR